MTGEVCGDGVEDGDVGLVAFVCGTCGGFVFSNMDSRGGCGRFLLEFVNLWGGYIEAFMTLAGLGDD